MLISKLVKSTIFGLCLIVSFSTTYAEDELHGWGQISESEWSLQPPRDFPHAPAIAIFNDGDLRVGLRDVKLKRHTRFKIFDRQSVSQITNVEILIRADDEFRDFKAQTHQPGGKSLSVNSASLLKKTISDELEIVSFSFPGVENGCIIELNYQIESTARSRDLPSWQFQSEFYSLESNFSITPYPGFVINTVMIGLDGEVLEAVENDTRIDGRLSKSFTWHRKAVPPLLEEPLRGAQLNFRPSIYLQFASQPSYNIFNQNLLQNWSDLDRNLSWIYDYALMRGDSLDSIVDSLVPDADTADTKCLLRVFQFVRDEITAIEAPFHHFFPSQSVTETLCRRVGSHVDKNLLLVAMLQELGYYAKPILVATRDYARFSTRIMNSRQFNYMLCHILVGDSTLILDVNDPEIPFPFLPPNLLADGGLVLDPGHLHRFKRGDLKRNLYDIPVDTVLLSLPQWPSGIRNNASVWLNSDGSAVCTTHVTVFGYEQLPLEADQVKKDWNSIIARLMVSVRDNTLELVDARRDTVDFIDSTVFDFVFRVADFSSISGDLFACIPTLLWSGTSPFTSSRRQFPIDFRYPVHFTEVLDLHTGVNATSPTFPADFTKITPDLVFSRVVLKHENSARFLTTFVIKRPLFAPAEYQMVQDFFNITSQSLREPFTMKIQ